MLGIDLLQPLPEGIDVRGTSDPYGIMDGRGAIVSRRVVDNLGLRIGKNFTALAGGRPVTFTVAAIVPAFTNVTFVAAAPRKVTVAPFWNAVPVMVTARPAGDEGG